MEKIWNFVSHYIIEYKSHVRDQKGNEFCSGSIYEEQFPSKIILIQCYYNKSLNIRIYLPPIITHLYLTINRNSSGNASNLEKLKKPKETEIVNHITIPNRSESRNERNSWKKQPASQKKKKEKKKEKEKKHVESRKKGES